MPQSWFTLGCLCCDVQEKNNETMGKHMEIIDAKNDNATSDDESDDTTSEE